MKLFLDCNGIGCSKKIPFKGNYNTVCDIRAKHGDFFPVKCPYCGQTRYYAYNEVRAVSPLGEKTTMALYWGAFLFLAFGTAAFVTLCMVKHLPMNHFLWIIVMPIGFLLIISAIAVSAMYISAKEFNEDCAMSKTPNFNADAVKDMDDDAVMKIAFKTGKIYEWPEIVEICDDDYLEMLYFSCTQNHGVVTEKVTLDLLNAYRGIGGYKHVEALQKAWMILEDNAKAIKECCTHPVYSEGEETFCNSQYVKKIEDLLANAEKAEPTVPLVAKFIREKVG